MDVLLLLLLNRLGDDFTWRPRGNVCRFPSETRLCATLCDAAGRRVDTPRWRRQANRTEPGEVKTTLRAGMREHW